MVEVVEIAAALGIDSHEFATEVKNVWRLGVSGRVDTPRWHVTRMERAIGPTARLRADRGQHFPLGARLVAPHLPACRLRRCGSSRMDATRRSAWRRAT
jgi:hypothetical protein